MKNLFVLFLLITLSVFSIEVKETALTMQEGIYYLNNKSFTGELLRQITGENNFKITDQYENGIYTGRTTYYYQSGKIKEISHFKDEYIEISNIKGTYLAKSGPSIEYYESGAKKAQGEYKGGLIQGSWKYYYESGKIEAEILYERGSENGKCTYYFENGKIQTSYTAEDGRKTGKVIQYYDDGKIQFDYNFYEGMLIGENRSYYPNGNLESIGNFKDYSKDKSSYNPKESKEGIYKNYYETGALKETGTYASNRRNGLTTSYYENGKIKMEIPFSNDQLDGEVKFFDETGKLKFSKSFEFGEEKN